MPCPDCQPAPHAAARRRRSAPPLRLRVPGCVSGAAETKERHPPPLPGPFQTAQAEQDAFGTSVGVQAHTLGAVVTPGLAAAMAPNSAAVKSAAKPLGWEAAAVPASFGMPSASTCGEWIVRAMGKGAVPVLTPYPGHAPLRRALSGR